MLDLGDVNGAVIATVLGAVTSLAGVALGALVEPLKLGAGERARVRRDRAERCAAYIEAATTAREQLVTVNVFHRLSQLAPDDPRADTEKALASQDAFYQARAAMRQVFGLLVMSGPEELVDLARQVRKAEMKLHDSRLELDPDGTFTDVLPPQMLAAVREFDDTVLTFARAARKHAG